MTSFEWMQKARERQTTVGSRGGPRSVFSGAWHALRSSLEASLDYYNRLRVGPPIALEVQDDNTLLVGGVTITRHAETHTISVSGGGRTRTESVFVPLDLRTLERLTEQILTPILFPGVAAIIRFE